ncbi:MAG: DUF72 domain-containing protein [Calditrichaeota bacterium]|nr:MAG: DUF72 domain-containing protein [Calditrichota bacterium]
MVKTGCCGFPVSREKYWQVFKLVEVQQTFYRLPRLETARKWRAAAPADFEFTLKAWQGVTHPATSPTYRRLGRPLSEAEKAGLGLFRPTRVVLEAWQATLEVARALEARVVVFQCPPALKETPETVQNLEAFFSRIERDRLQLAIEFRAPWRAETVGRLCRKLGLVHCVDPFKEPALAGTFRYYRLHGSPPGKQMYRYRYHPADFDFLAGRIREDLAAGFSVYCLFNNLSMWEDARAFRERLLSSGTGDAEVI